MSVCERLKRRNQAPGDMWQGDPMPRVTQAFRDKQQARIYAAATHCFARAGFHATSMDDVIREAGMSSSTVYRYLPGGKQALICWVCTTRVGRLATRLDQLRQETEPPGIRDTLVSTLAGLYEDDPDADFTMIARLAVNAWAELPRNPEFREKLKGIFADIRCHLLELTTRWHENELLRISPAEASEITLRTALGLIAEEALYGGVDINAAGEALQHLLETPPRE